MERWADEHWSNVGCEYQASWITKLYLSHWSTMAISYSTCVTKWLSHIRSTHGHIIHMHMCIIIYDHCTSYSQMFLCFLVHLSATTVMLPLHKLPSNLWNIPRKWLDFITVYNTDIVFISSITLILVTPTYDQSRMKANSIAWKHLRKQYIWKWNSPRRPRPK